MKRIVMLVCAWCCVVPGFTQVVALCTDKTTSLVFSFPIRHIDIGSNEVLVQQVKDAENILLVKAAVPGFRPTNISVITADGQLYSIDVAFEKQPARSVYQIVASGVNRVSFEGELMNMADLKTYSTAIIDNPRQLRGAWYRKWDVQARIEGIYTKDNVLFVQLGIENFSSIGFDVGFMRFYIVDRKKSKRTAVQELELQPLISVGSVKQVPAHGKTVAVFALEKFTIPDQKQFVIQVAEKNGGRHLRLKLGNRRIVRAKILPSLK